jgi:GH15 family glucan-1,4-alpha-glucosidase
VVQGQRPVRWLYSRNADFRIDQPDEGIWETRGGPQKLLYSQLMCWVATERAIRLATRRGLPADLGRWRKARDAICRRTMDRG